MINLGFIITLCCSFNLALSQHIINLEIKNLPPDHPSNSAIYIAGSFNDWNPKDEKFRFVQNAEGNYAIQIKLDKGRYEYKITRGSWDKVECRLNGQGISNRQLPVDNDISIDLIIEQWQDRMPAKARASTANKSVHVMDTAFWIPQLKRSRRIWIYLPATYHQNKKERFDVLYLHDGQNVFDDSTSFAGEWGVDESMAMLTRQSIVVAIDHGGNNRNTEYNPYDHDRYGKGEGNQYVDFIAKTLKPHIDKNYRTRKGKENTMIAGSSLAGLVTMYAVLKYPKVFGGAGVFSPSFWIAPQIYDEIRRRGAKVKSRIYFFAGKLESETMVPNMLKVFEAMLKVSKSKMKTVIRDEGKHNEATWREEFVAGYKYLLGN